MKYPLYLFALTFLLSGCAKVTQEVAPCKNPPQINHIDDAIIPTGYSVTFDAVSSANNAKYNWTGPDNFTYKGDQLEVYVYDSSQYGLYTVALTDVVCTGKTDSFYILPNHPGSPPCSVVSSDYNKLIVSDGRTLNIAFPSTSGFGGRFCSDGYEVSAESPNTGLYISVSTASQPVPGGYYTLANTCPTHYDNALVTIYDNQNGAFYTSQSGRIYCNMISGQLYLTFCGAVFYKRTSSTTVTITGNMSY